MWIDIFEHECGDGFGYVERGNVNEIGHRSVTSPGILRVMEIAHARSGRMPWSELFTAAVAVPNTRQADNWPELIPI
jgi:gamma-glutamyltranspeptidase/glutathione hydrolase